MTEESPAIAPILTIGRSQASACAGRVDADGDRIGDVELGVVDDAGEDEGDRDVEHGTDRERAENADRHVLLRILGLLRRRGHRVESDVREEDHARPADDAVPAVLARGPPAAGTNGSQLSRLM